MEKDLSDKVDETFIKVDELLKANRVDEALERIYQTEKLSRNAHDVLSTSRLLRRIVKICCDKKNWTLLNDNIKVIIKRPNQIKQAITNMIQEACERLDEIPDEATKIKIMKTIREVSEGKIYLELERARLTKKLSEIYEKQKDFKKALSLLQDIQIDTIGTMEKKEKIEFILHQMRLCLENKDFLKMNIFSKKINIKNYDDTFKDQKMQFYSLMIQLGQNENKYFTVFTNYKCLDDLLKDQEEIEAQKVLANMVIYLTLSPYSLEQNDMINRLYKDKRLEKMQLFKQLIKLFLTQELIDNAKVITQYQTTILSIPGFKSIPSFVQANQSWAEDMKSRIYEHNIRVIAKYYKRIYLDRLAQLLGMDIEKTEDILRNLIVDKTINARIDRIEKQVTFNLMTDSVVDDALNEWSFNNNAIMNLVNKANHIINKELMIRKFKPEKVL